jgi:hypothetical protein
MQLTNDVHKLPMAIRVKRPPSPPATEQHQHNEMRDIQEPHQPAAVGGDAVTAIAHLPYSGRVDQVVHSQAPSLVIRGGKQSQEVEPSRQAAPGAVMKQMSPVYRVRLHAAMKKVRLTDRQAPNHHTAHKQVVERANIRPVPAQMPKKQVTPKAKKCITHHCISKVTPNKSCNMTKSNSSHNWMCGDTDLMGSAEAKLYAKQLQASNATRKLTVEDIFLETYT